MPLGKYYCDYCDKQFQDTPFARKRHIQGLQHQRAKALWYDSLRDSNQPYQDSFGIGVCNRFVRTGSCPYGDTCKYFHPKPNIQSQSTAGVGAANLMETTQSASITGSQLVGGSSLPGNIVGDSLGISLGNLPPSLKPPLEGGYPILPFVDWG